MVALGSRALVCIPLCLAWIAEREELRIRLGLVSIGRPLVELRGRLIAIGTALVVVRRALIEVSGRLIDEAAV